MSKKKKPSLDTSDGWKVVKDCGGDCKNQYLLNGGIGIIKEWKNGQYTAEVMYICHCWYPLHSLSAAKLWCETQLDLIEVLQIKWN